ncbi:G-protein coupled receptor dmsr-1-like [Anthonomus grandis grandis]|uniref:G-protein coupled receptor dmsr-1-like n=1 Tax=Anthonomus grandis grandis TaxID=2921223 RepID=UPI00216513B0|nr:G-protein coupled receptor dmsr-1-like [Anthonomus grandis grandis]
MSSAFGNISETKILIMKILESKNITITEELLNKIIRFNPGTASTNSVELNQDPSCGGQFKLWANVYAKEYHPYCAVIVCLFGIITNCLNIIVLTRKDMATAPINKILTALAWADMLLMIEYIPFVVYDKVDSEAKELTYNGAVFMLFHNHITQILHTTSICLTLMLAIWRFLAIRFIDQNHILCSHHRCSIGIMTCYTLPLLLCLPQYITFKIEQVNITEEGKVVTLYRVNLSHIVVKQEVILKINFWLYSIFLKLLPCLILIIISIWLIRTLFKAKKGRQILKGNFDSVPLAVQGKGNNIKQSKYERRADRTTRMLIAILTLFLLTELPQGLFAFIIGLHGLKLFVTCYQQYGEIMDILALFSGCINFILYCCMNRMFRVTFGQLFKNRVIGRWTQGAASETVTTAPAIEQVTTAV